MSSNFHEEVRALVEARMFTIGRTGGPDNDFCCDCYVIRSGLPFHNGLNVIRTFFRQRP
jgi:hypothetical protein